MQEEGVNLPCHNNMSKEWHALCANALSESAVSDEPLIHTNLPRNDKDNAAPCKNAPATTANNPTNPENRGDILVHGFWKRGCSCIFDIRITNTDCSSALRSDPVAVLTHHKNDKKQKHLQLCLDWRRHFTPLVFSINGHRGAEANAASKCLATLLTTKWQQPYSQVCGFVRSRLAIALN